MSWHLYRRYCLVTVSKHAGFWSHQMSRIFPLSGENFIARSFVFLFREFDWSPNELITQKNGPLKGPLSSLIRSYIWLIFHHYRNLTNLYQKFVWDLKTPTRKQLVIVSSVLIWFSFLDFFFPFGSNSFWNQRWRFDRFIWSRVEILWCIFGMVLMFTFDYVFTCTSDCFDRDLGVQVWIKHNEPFNYLSCIT